MKLSIKTTINKNTESPIKFWAGTDPLNPSKNKVLAVKRGIFTSFYSFPKAENLDSIDIIRKISHKNGELTVFLDLEAATQKELQDLHNFKGYIDQLPEEYRADLSQEPAFRTFAVPIIENTTHSSGETEKSLQSLINEKKAELQTIRQQILDAQADEDETLLAELRPKRDLLKNEIFNLEKHIQK